MQMGELHPLSIARYARFVRTLIFVVFIVLGLGLSEPVPEHLLPGDPAPWLEKLLALVEDPRTFPQNQTAEIPEKGLVIYEYVNVKLPGRTFETVLLALKKDDPENYVIELTPGTKGKPLAPEEFGDVELLGEGPNYWVFRILEGPFKDHILVWSTATGHRGVGGEAARIYSPKAAASEPALADFLKP